jgi:hypothetical protein
MTDKKEEGPFTVGETIYLSSGSYSDYEVFGVYVVRKPFDVENFKTACRYSDKRIDYARLESEGYIERVHAREIWVGEN